MSFRSLGTTASFSIIEAIVRTSYGVRFFDRAYAEIDVLPVHCEGLQLRVDELRGRRLREEVVGRREEEALERVRLRSEPRDVTRVTCSEVRLRRQVRAPAMFAGSDLRNGLHALRHVGAREAFGEDDAKRLRRRRDRRRDRSLRAAAGERGDED
jgi:hypothetical protein